jgi:guanylate kinase
MVLSSPSGGGKTSVCAELLARLPWLKRCVTATTRPPRAGERDGVDYWFLSRPAFEQRLKRGEFFEHAEVHGNLYGTPMREVERSLKAGQSLVLVIDVQGAAQVRRRKKDAVTVFLLPPSLSELKRRLAGRGTDAAEVVRRRLADAGGELARAGEYQYWVVNDRFERAVEQAAAIAVAESLRRH